MILSPAQKRVLNHLQRGGGSFSIHDFHWRAFKTIAALVKRGLVKVENEQVILLEENGSWLYTNPTTTTGASAADATATATSAPRVSPYMSGALDNATTATRSRPSPLKVALMWADGIETMLNQTREFLSDIGVGDHPAFAEVDRGYIESVRRLRDNTVDYYNRILGYMEQVANKETPS